MIKLSNIEFLKDPIKIFSSKIDDANFRINDEGINIKATDLAKVVLFDYFLSKESFDSYEVEPLLVGVNVQELNKILKYSGGEDVLELNFSENFLDLKIKGKVVREYSIPLLEPSDYNIKINQEYSSILTMNVKELRDLVKEASAVSPNLHFKNRDGNFEIIAKSNSGLKFKAKLDNVSFEKESDFFVAVSTPLLKTILDDMKGDSKIRLFFKDNSPLKIQYSLGKNLLTIYVANLIV